MAGVQPLLMAAFFAVVLLEFGLLYLAPHLLAQLAPIRAGLDRSLHVPASRVSGGLPEPELPSDTDFAARWTPHSNTAWVRLKYKWIGFNRSLGIGRVSVEVQGHASPPSYRESAEEPTVRVEIRVRWWPVPMSAFFGMLALALLTLAVDPTTAAMLLLGAAFGGGLQGLLSYSRIRPALVAVADEIEMALEQPAHLRTGL